jgi:hypothetical protein
MMGGWGGAGIRLTKLGHIVYCTWLLPGSSPKRLMCKHEIKIIIYLDFL